MSDSVRPHRRQPTRLPRPWDSPGKNTGVGCHFLLQCMEVKSESEVAQSCPTLWDPMGCSPPGSSVRGVFQARVLEWGAIAFSAYYWVLAYFSSLTSSCSVLAICTPAFWTIWGSLSNFSLLWMDCSFCLQHWNLETCLFSVLQQVFSSSTRLDHASLLYVLPRWLLRWLWSGPYFLRYFYLS